MLRILSGLLALVCAFGTHAAAQPSVVTDIAPVHSIVARVMEGRGAPALLLEPGSSPHGYAMRPSDARALQQADLVIWVGPSLTPWLEGPLATLTADARSIVLEDVAGGIRLEPREGARFAAHDHPEDGGGHEHGHEHEHEGHHDDDPIDPHMWLDPRNAAIWATVIAQALADADPDSASVYTANAETFGAELAALESEIGARMTPLQGRPFIVFHDAYHYFEARFGTEAEGAIALTDASMPGAKRLRAVREMLRETQTRCLFIEPQQPEKLARTVAEGMAVRIATLDPIGVGLTPGSALYTSLLRNLSDAFEQCLASE